MRILLSLIVLILMMNLSGCTPPENITENIIIEDNPDNNTSASVLAFTSSDTVIVYENQTSVLTLETDSVNNITYTIRDGDSASFLLDENTGIILFVNSPSAGQSYSFTAIATDVEGNTVNTTITVAVVAVAVVAVVDEDAPVFSSASSVTVYANQSSAITLIAYDVSSVTYAISGGDSASFSVDVNSGIVTFNTNPSVGETYSFIATATDSYVNSSDQNISLNVIADSVAPVFTSESNVSVDENQLRVLTVETNDTSPVTYSISGIDGVYFVIDANSGILDFADLSYADYERSITNGYYYVEVNALDSSSNQSTQILYVYLNDLNEIAPTFSQSFAASVQVYENELYVIDLNATDDNGSVIYSLDTTNNGDLFNINSTGEVSFNVAPDYEAIAIDYNFTAIATDEVGNVATRDVYVNILDKDDIVLKFTKVSNGSSDISYRVNHQAVSFDSKLFVYAGNDGSQLKDIWSSSDGSTWTLNDANASFGLREKHRVLEFNNVLYMIGAKDKQDVWSSTDGYVWTQKTDLINASYTLREDYQVLSFKSKMYILGGFDGSYLNDTWVSSDGVTWSKNTSDYTARSQHASIVFKNEMYIVGGYDGFSALNDVWSSSDGVTWTQKLANAPFSARYNHKLIVYNHTLFLVGGSNGNKFNDIWYTYDGVNWFESKNSYLPDIESHQLVVHNNQVINIGGMASVTDVYGSNRFFTPLVMKTAQQTVYASYDDASLNKGLDSNFSIVGNTVVDSVNEIIWQRDAGDATASTHADALAYCQGLVLDGYSNWSLPTSSELETIIGFGTTEGINNNFINVQTGTYYWSKTVSATTSNYYWLTYADSGFTTTDLETNTHSILCKVGE